MRWFAPAKIQANAAQICLIACCALITFFVTTSTLHAEPVKDGIPRYVETTLIPEKDAITPGETMTIAVRQIHAPEWHTYWKNAGDSGETTHVAWTLPEGFRNGDLHYPVPHRIAYGPLMNFGFSGDSVILTDITAPATLPANDVTLTASITWLVCKDICIPEETKATLVLPVATKDHPAKETNPDFFTAARAALPEQKSWKGRIEEQDQTLTLSFTPDQESLTELGQAKDFFFFPEEWGIMQNPAAQENLLQGSDLTLKLQRDVRPLSDLTELKGVLSYETADGAYKGVEVSLPVTAGKASAATANDFEPLPTVEQEDMPLVNILGLAVLGGLILNLMPCVFPVLSMKALSLVKMSAKEKKHAALHGVFYTAGVLLCFGAIAGTLMALRSAGEEIGWGFQLQNPVAVILLAYLLFAMAMNLSGFFEFKGHLFSNLGHKLAARHGYTGTFFTGMLATVVATPCTAPFMGAAMGYAMTQPPVIAMTVFLALGFGLALPYLALCLVPVLQKALPRPGPWMEVFRQFMSFPLYLSTAWLVWVYHQQIPGGYGVMLVLTGLVLLAFSVWIVRHTPRRQPMKSAIHGLSWFAVFLAALIVFVSGIERPSPNPAEQDTPQKTTSETSAIPYSANLYAEALKGDKPIFAYMTAAWCITCKWNEQTSINIESTSTLFKEKDIVVFEGDWTNKNPEITEFLSHYGRSGVPLYIYTGPRDPVTGKRPAPVVLPQILTPETVAEYINQNERK